MSGKFIVPIQLPQLNAKPDTNPAEGYYKVYLRGGKLKKLNHLGVEQDVEGDVPETDPIFIASPAAAITTINIAQWNQAFAWGNHGTAGYLTVAQFNNTAAASITTSNINNWNAAYSWGNHSAAGYLLQGAFNDSPAGGITTTNINNWNTAYGWGNHAVANYLTVASAAVTYASLTGSYNNPSWITSLAWSKITGAPAFITGITSSDVVTALGYTPVTNARTITINGTTYDLTANRTWSVGDLLSSGSYSDPSWITSLAWSKITGAPSFLTSAITSLNGLTGTTQTFVNDTNVTMVSTGTTHTLTWSGTLADSRIASSTNWNTAYTNRITSLTTTGSSGAATLVSNVLNIPNYTLSGLGGQPLNANLTSISTLTYASTSFVKMTAAGTFALDTNTYLTAESDTLASVTGRGNSTTNAITVGNATINGTIRNTIGSANLYTSNVIGATTLSLHSDTPISSNYFIRADTQSVILNAPQTSGNIVFRQANGSIGQFFGTTGNLILQNGGTFTDAGYRLDVNGTARIQGEANVSFLTLGGSTAVNNSGTTLVIGASGAWAGVRVPRYFETTGSITAASAIARGVYMNQTLVASANNDTLVGLDIQPTFTVGSFTGVSNIPLRIRNTTNTGNIYSIDQIGNCVIGGSLSTNSVYASGNLNLSSGGNDLKLQTNYTANTGLQMFNATRNVVIQNGGTFTDAGFRLDVNGTARIQGTTTITPTAVTGALTTSSLDIAQTWNTTGTPIAIKLNVTDTASGNLSDLLQLQVGGSPRFRILKSGFFTHSSGGEISGSVVIGGATINTSSILEARSLTQGFLPPRMTTTQKNAIATPPSGLIVYDNTLGKLCVRGASTWETITSI